MIAPGSEGIGLFNFGIFFKKKDNRTPVSPDHSNSVIEIQATIEEEKPPEELVQGDTSFLTTFSQRSKEYRDTYLAKLPQRFDESKNSSIPLDERKSGKLYRQKQINQIIDLFKQGEQAVMLEGGIGVGKTTTLLEMYDHLSNERIPVLYTIADRADLRNQGKLSTLIQRLEHFSNLNDNEPTLLIVENATDLVGNFMTFNPTRSYSYEYLLEKLKEGGHLDDQERKALKYYQDVEKVIRLLSGSHFRVVLGSYEKTFDVEQAHDRRLARIWKENLGFTKVVLPETITGEAAEAVLIDSLTKQIGVQDSPRLNLDDKESRAAISAISQNENFTFRKLKHINIAQFLILRRSVARFGSEGALGAIESIAGQI